MAINFKKLKSQIKPFAPEAGGKGYIFIADLKQSILGIDSVALKGSKRKLIKAMVEYIKIYPEYKEEFTL